MQTCGYHDASTHFERSNYPKRLESQSSTTQHNQMKWQISKTARQIYAWKTSLNNNKQKLWHAHTHRPFMITPNNINKIVQRMNSRRDWTLLLDLDCCCGFCFDYTAERTYIVTVNIINTTKFAERKLFANVKIQQTLNQRTSLPNCKYYQVVLLIKRKH